MTATSVETPPNAAPVALRDPVLAGIFAWLIPGAGHFYQGRRTKALLFFLCIVATWSYGLWLGDGRVVYAAWGPTSEEKRLPYICQIGAGVMALPAVRQAQLYGDKNYRAEMQRKETSPNGRTFLEKFMAPPVLNVDLPTGGRMKELDYLNYRLNRRFELGTVYTMVAGLLNLIVVFDAIGGPAYGNASARRRKESEDAESAAAKSTQARSTEPKASGERPAPAG